MRQRMSMSSAKPAARTFDAVETWVFDLDNTLYPHDLNLWQQIDDRIRSFVSNFLKVTKEEAFRVQKDYYKRYGTTMRGLMAEHGLKPDDFLEFVHKIDHSPLLPNAELGDAIEKLPGRRRGDEAARDRPPFRGRVRYRRGRSRSQAPAAGL
jgi:putative hydrolase of the HAD superfamily